MGVVAYLCTASQPVTRLADPSGGDFDAAGDFDRVIPASNDRLPLLSQVDPHGDFELAQPSMPALLAERPESALSTISWT